MTPTPTNTTAATPSRTERRLATVSLCRSSLGQARRAVEDELGREAARQAAAMLYGQEIGAESTVRNFTLVEDEVWTRLLGRVRLVDSPVFAAGQNPGEICIFAEYFITQEDWRIYGLQPVELEREVCRPVSDAEKQNVAAESYTKEAALIEALHDYDSRLGGAPHELLLALPKQVRFEDAEARLYGNVAFYCVAQLQMAVLPDEVRALLERSAVGSTADPTPAATVTRRETATRTAIQTAIQAPTSTGTPTAVPASAPVDSAATIEAAVKATVDAQSAVQRAVEATLTARAPTWTPMPTATPRPTSTPTRRPTATPNHTATVRAVATATARAQATTTERARNTSRAQATATAQRRATETAQGRAFVGEVTTQQLNVRAGPGTGFGVIAQLRQRDEVVVLGRTDDQSWLQVRTASGASGWVSASYVRTGQSVSRYPVVVVPPTPTPSSCRLAVDSGLWDRWSREEMGCPTTASAVVWAAWQPFQRGQMLWRRDTDAAYVFIQGGGWSQLGDRWNESIPVPSRGGPPPGLQAPVRGFGYVWGTHDWIYQGLGWALDKEKGFCGLVQEFEKGFLLRSSGVDSCWQGLYNHAREGSFGLGFLKAHSDGYWQQ